MKARLARVATGAVVGLTWSAALRTWMVELAGPASTFTSQTVLLVLAPGTVVGAVCGWSWARHADGLLPPRWAAWSPALLASAIASPEIFRALVTTGQGGGAVIVAGTGAAGAAALSGRGPSRGRTAAMVGWLLGVAAVGGMGTIAGSPATPRGMLVCASGAGLVALLGVGLAVNHPGGPDLGVNGRRLALGGSVAAWAGTVTLVLTGDRARAALVPGPSAPHTIWALSLAGGLLVTAAAAVLWWRRPLPVGGAACRSPRA